MRRVVIAAAALTGLSACASMSEDECLTADWRTVGYGDGARGAPAEAVDSHRRACARHGVTPDLSDYLAGRDEGLRVFCRPNRGYALGVDGVAYAGVCPADLEPAFLTAYEDGRGLYARRQTVSAIVQTLEQRRERLEQIEHSMVSAEVTLVGLEASVEERAHLLLEIKQLIEERTHVSRDIEELTYDLAQAERDLADYEAYLGARAF